MKLFPVHPILWTSLLFFCASQTAETEADHPDVCQGEKYHGDIFAESPEDQEEHNVEEAEVEVEGRFHCHLHPTNILNCSWSFPLQEDTQLFVSISICDDNRTVHSPNFSPAERVGSRSFFLQEHEALNVFLRFNISLHDQWTVYTSSYDVDMLEVLSPPQNISASVKDGGLLVTWDLPHSRTDSNPSCFEYQLDLGDQERPKVFTDQLSYTEPNPDPSSTYRVRMRSRRMFTCQASAQWSDWSQAVTVSVSQLNNLVIISISLGIPMILLALLLLVRYQRVTKILFPPIPRPPAKYKHFLEKNDTFNLFHSAPSAEPVEEITEVEVKELKPAKTL